MTLKNTPCHIVSHWRDESGVDGLYPAYQEKSDTEEFDQAIGAALDMVNLKDTFVIVTADHSHVFTIAGYLMREPA
jgi:2,3-bisphosphoglycerate-independent phosphoglycerate mutase